ncbi:RDD family protein, partial [Streptomyces sp. NPDC057654]
RVALRSVLLVVVIPAVVWDRDSRGLHDKLARAVQVRI